MTTNDMSSHLLTQWGIRVPGYRSETKEKEKELSLRSDAHASTHRARLDLKVKLQAEEGDA